MASSFLRYLGHTQRRTTVGRTHLDERTARRRDLYLTTYDIHNIPCPCGIRTHDLSRRATADLRFRPRGHWDRQEFMIQIQKSIKIFLNYPFPYSACSQYACAQFLLRSFHRILRLTERLD
jgi:hypothetical protein